MQNNASEKVTLYQNYPNPFSSETKMNFCLSSSQFVTLTVYDLMGHELEILVNQFMKSGNNLAVLKAGNVRNGLFYNCLKAGDYSETKKLILVR